MNVEPEKIQALINILQSMLVAEDPTENIQQPISATKSKPKQKKINKNSSINKPKFNNKFDAMPELTMHKEDTILDQKLNIRPPVPRTRPFELADVHCRVCGKKDTINPAIVSDIQRYKCNKCSSSPG